MEKMKNDDLYNEAKKKVEEFDTKESKIYAAKRLARFFEIDISLKILGVEVFHWHFPPTNN